MNSIEAAFDKNCVGFGQQPFKVRARCVDLVVQYLFRGVNYKDLKQRLQQVWEKVERAHEKDKRVRLMNPIDITAMVHQVTHKGEIVKHIKLWLLSCADRGVSCSSKVLRREFKIEGQDKWLDKMFSPKTTRLIKSLAHKYQVFSLAEIDRVVVNIDLEISVWARKFLNKKLTFIRKGQNMTLYDMHRELFERGCRGLFLMIPKFDSALHATNVVKRTVRNQGLNMIQAFTTQKRGRTLRNSDMVTFSSNTVSLDAYAPAENQQAMANMVQDMRRNDLSIDVSQFHDNLKHEKQREFVGLLMGNTNAKFYEWLRQQKILSKYEELPTKEFIEVCFDYLHLKPKRGWKFVRKMQEHFGSYYMGSTSDYRMPDRRERRAN